MNNRLSRQLHLVMNLCNHMQSSGPYLTIHTHPSPRKYRTCKPVHYQRSSEMMVIDAVTMVMLARLA